MIRVAAVDVVLQYGYDEMPIGYVEAIDQG